MGLFSTYIRESVPFEKTIKHIYEGLKPEDATKLLDAFQKEAEKRVLSQVHIRTNTIEGSVCVLNDNPASLDKTCMCRFILNGKEYIAKTKVDSMEIRLDDHKELTKILFKSISERISADLLKQAFSKG